VSARRHLLVTNDFPPKIGGIQSYLWELWRRLPADSFAVYTTPHRGAAAFDARQPFPVERSPEPVLGPYPWLVDRVNRQARQVGADLVLLDPAIPLGVIGPYLDRPYGVVLHGAEVTIPARLPGSRQLLARTLRSASLVVAAGNYPLSEAERCAGISLPSVVVPPGVDSERFRPYPEHERQAARRRFGLADSDFAVATVNRLVPRKGMDTLVRAAAQLHRSSRRDERRLRVLIGGEGRHRARLERAAGELAAPVELLGRLGDGEVADLYGAADAMAMLCHERWLGLEQEGFGIVFLEAAAAGLPQVAGRSGGAHEAVEDGVTGLVVDEPRNHLAVAAAVEALMADPEWCRKLGAAARERAVRDFDHAKLALRLQAAIEAAPV
jgi:phosphatidylinositol alpha-1,6-mannosyltransferase